MLTWLLFILCSAAVLVGGVQLSKYGDIIAEKTGMGRTWIGVILLASVTSLPELFTGFSAVAVYRVPDIAVGDILGSCMFNILIIALLDALGGAAPITARVYQGQILTAAFGILALALVCISIVAAGSIPAIGWLSVASVAFFVIYLFAMRTIFIYEQRRIAAFVEEVAEAVNYEHVTFRYAVTRFSLNGALVIIAATYLPGLSAELAAITGLGQTFFGAIFVALITSLPEVVVAVAALRMNAVDMAVGNIFGSNLFNVGLILALDDLLYTPGPLLAGVSTSHMLAAIGAIAMTAVAVVGLVYRLERKAFLVARDSLGIIAIYVVTTALLYNTRGG
ncbi:MAG: sodium:calcium antiporter [Oscillochloridaceae bacterium]|nr:sodium:calcium antiporter [Chloroflexaceae bacterium]MDW8392316.1 sodium:calcium antiporter [Oscillochloridaceae bacterium]